MADMVYVLASGGRIDTKVVERFKEQIDDIYRNPFEKAKKQSTAEEIKQHVIDLLTR